MMRSVKYGVQVAAICMVSLVGFMVYVSQSGCSCVDADEERFTVQMRFADISYRDIEGEQYRDVTIDLLKFTPKDEKFHSSELRAVIKSMDRTVVNSATPLEPHEPLMYDDGSDGRVDVQFWHIDTDGNSWFSAGDVIKITGMTSEYDEAYFMLFKAGENVGSITLPPIYP